MQDWSRCKRVQLPLVLITVALRGYYNNYNRQQCAYLTPTTNYRIMFKNYQTCVWLANHNNKMFNEKQHLLI